MQSHLSLIMSTLQYGLPTFIGHTFLTLALLFLLSSAYMWLTHQKFLRYVQGHNMAAAITFGSIYVAFSIPLAAALAGSVTALDILIWAIPLGIIQFVTYLAFDAIFRNLPKRVEENDVAVAVLVALVRISVAIVMAGAIVD